MGSGRLSRERERERERERGWRKERDGAEGGGSGTGTSVSGPWDYIGAGWSTSIGARIRSFVSFHPGLFAVNYGNYYDY